MNDSVPDADDCELVSRVTAGVYQSGLVGEFPPAVDAVLCLCLPAEMEYARRAGYPDLWAQTRLREFAWRPIPDDFRAVPSLDWLDAAAALVGDWRAAGRTALVHCAAGISRSTLVTAAYLIRAYTWPAAEALAFVKTARPVAAPNTGFVDLLARYAGWRRRVGAAAA